MREKLNAAMKQAWQEWEIPRATEDPWPIEPRRHFEAVRAEQAKGANARPSKIGEGLLALNQALKRDYTLETLPDRPVDPWPEPAAKLHCGLVAGPHRSPAGDRRLHRRQGRFRAPLRQAL